MKAEKLKHLKQILDSMTEREKTVLNDYLTSFDSRGKGYKPKTLILLQLLNKYDDLDDVYRLFKKKMPSDDAIRMNINRLKDKIGESLLLDINISHEDAYDEISRVRVEVAKKKLVALIYIGRGLRTEALELYDKVISLGSKYELYNEVIEVQYLKQQTIGLKFGKKEFDKLNDSIAFNEQCRTAFQNARKAYHEIILNYGFKGLNRSNPDPKYEQELEQKLNQLNADFKNTKSAQVGYYYNLLMIELNQVRRNIHQASKHCEHLVKTVKENPSVYHKRRLGIAYLNFSQNELFDFNFDSALAKALEGMACFPANSPNHSLGMELEFYAAFYSGKLAEAKEIITSLLTNEKLDQSDFRYAKWNYLLACVHFAEGNFSQVLLTLNEAHKMDKDREGWNIGIRVLSILNAIESEQFDYADSLIVNLRQFIKEALKEQAVRDRDRNILEILLNLRKNAYNFKETKEAKEDLLHKLEENSAENGWEIQSPELIVFQQWFDGKLAGKATFDFSRKSIYSSD